MPISTLELRRTIPVFTARMVSNQSNILQAQHLCNSKFPVDLSISEDNLCLKILIPMSEIEEYNPSLLETLTSFGLDMEYGFMDIKLENAVTSVYRDQVFEAYKFLDVNQQFTVDSIQGNTSVELVDYAEDDLALAFRFVVSSGDNSELYDSGLDIFEYINLDTMKKMFRPLFDLFDDSYKRMMLVTKTVSIMSAPPVKDPGLDGLFQMLIRKQR